MRNGEASIDIRETPEAIFDLVHDYSRRLEWDPFLRQADLLEGAVEAGPGVSSRCVARRAAGGLGMETVYVSFCRPTVAAVKMTRGPALFQSFAASLRQRPVDSQHTRVTYRYQFRARPRWLAFVLEPVVGRIFHYETRRRLQALKRFLERAPAGRETVLAGNARKPPSQPPPIRLQCQSRRRPDGGPVSATRRKAFP